MEGHRYWLRMTEQHNLSHPKDAADAVRSEADSWVIYVFMPVDAVINRFHWVPEFKRSAESSCHYLYDDKGIQQKAVVLRASTIMLPMRPSPKSLHEGSRTPCLYDTTLPQHRLDQGEVPRPLQGEFPVWYFLTGEISRPENLQKLLQLNDLPDLRPANMKDFKEICGREYSPLVVTIDADIINDRAFCEGHAYLVRSEAEELALRRFKTATFDVIRCRFTISKRNTFATYSDVKGLTFIHTPGENLSQTVMNGPITSIERVMGSKHKETLSKWQPPALVALKSAPTVQFSPQGAMAPRSRGGLVLRTDLNAGAWWDDGDDDDDQYRESPVGERTFTPAVRPLRMGDLPDQMIAPPRGCGPPLRSGLPRSTYRISQSAQTAGPAVRLQRPRYKGVEPEAEHGVDTCHSPNSMEGHRFRNYMEGEDAEEDEEAKLQGEREDIVQAQFERNLQEAQDAEMARRLQEELNRGPPSSKPLSLRPGPSSKSKAFSAASTLADEDQSIYNPLWSSLYSLEPPTPSSSADCLSEATPPPSQPSCPHQPTAAQTTTASFQHNAVWNADWSAFEDPVEPLRRVSAAELSGIQRSGNLEATTQVSVKEVNPEEDESDEGERNSNEDERESGKEEHDYCILEGTFTEHGTFVPRGRRTAREWTGPSDNSTHPQSKGKDKAVEFF
ncbi:hypothetical protein T440DRAFT_514729 [Plenodomus tracheiphilus IPT5]|uniref:Uncharacterized protein n=1 Tax=Plenodomus tracheiphilus IPT5 TaxID=1408161 RepID=A0A6A7BH56_9PLEO|nr:hypothetical protein T440DRAFT_514729 [Plenodomus tracheiphilus IPT5]